MQWQKTPIEIKAKIIEAKINRNAQWSVIAEELWIPERTVQHIINTDLAEVCGESKVAGSLIDRNNKLVSAAEALMNDMIASKHETITLAQLNSVRDSAWKQNQVMEWKPTDNIKYSITDITIE